MMNFVGLRKRGASGNRQEIVILSDKETMGNYGYCLHTQSMLIIHKNTLLYFPITKNILYYRKKKYIAIKT